MPVRWNRRIQEISGGMAISREELPEKAVRSGLCTTCVAGIQKL